MSIGSISPQVTVVRPALGYSYFCLGPWLPSQLQTWWPYIRYNLIDDRRLYVNNLPRVIMWKWNVQDSQSWVQCTVCYTIIPRIHLWYRVTAFNELTFYLVYFCAFLFSLPSECHFSHNIWNGKFTFCHCQFVWYCTCPHNLHVRKLKCHLNLWILFALLQAKQANAASWVCTQHTTALMWPQSTTSWSLLTSTLTDHKCKKQSL